MRKILALFFIPPLLLLGTTMPAFAATGEGNIDGGGGNMGSGILRAIGIPVWTA